MNPRIVKIIPFFAFCFVLAVGAYTEAALGQASAGLATAAAGLAVDTIPIRSPEGAVTRYGLKSGRIVMRYNGSASGVRTVVFDQWGIRERMEDSSYSPDVKNLQLNRNYISITSKDFFIFAIKQERVYQKMPNTMIDQFLQSDPLKQKCFGREIIEHGPFSKRLPDTTISGYKCRVYGNDTLGVETTVYFWRGIPLHTQVVNRKDSVNFTIDAVKFEPNVVTTDAMFTLPANYKEMAPPGGSAAPSGRKRHR